jgi:hypoxia up-regulated 1
MNVNSDEAAVLGAALHGASLSRQFRTKDIKLSDISPYDVQVSYLAEAKSTEVSDATPRTITSLAFARGSRTGTRKTLTFRRKNDFSLAFSYKEPPASEFPVELLDARISGVAEALANITEAGGVDPVIKATILFSESGFVSVPQAIAYAEIKDDSLAGASTPSCYLGLQGNADYVCRETQGLVWRWLILRGGWVNFNRRSIGLVIRSQVD